MKLIHNNQKGFPLVEILIMLPIIAPVGVATSGTIAQLMQSSRTTEHITALRQVQSAGYWVSCDGIQAENISTTGYFLYVGRTDPGDGNLHEVVYSLQDMPSGTLKQLQRQESLNGTPSARTIVGRYIDPAQTSCVWNGKTLVFTVTATMNQQTETRTYEVQPRPFT